MKKRFPLENIPVKSQLLQQNCFLRDLYPGSCSSACPPDKFVSVDEVVTDTGVQLKYSENDYPITPQYVNSFVDSSDYRNDVVSAIANGHKRQNLGDITDFQKVASMDMESARALYKQLSEVFAKSVPSDVPSDNSPEEVKK